MPRKTKPRVRTYERKAYVTAAITPVEYGGLQEAFDYLNRTLFDACALPNAMLAYQRPRALRRLLLPGALRQSSRCWRVLRRDRADPDGFLGSATNSSSPSCCTRSCISAARSRQVTVARLS